MDRRPGPLGPENVLEVLVNALNRHGLAAYSYEAEGARYVHVSPPSAPAAGTDLRLAREGGRVCFFSEWGSSMGGHIPAVACRVLWWFGKSRPRP